MPPLRVAKSPITEAKPSRRFQHSWLPWLENHYSPSFPDCFPLLHIPHSPLPLILFSPSFPLTYGFSLPSCLAGNFLNWTLLESPSLFTELNFSPDPNVPLMFASLQPCDVRFKAQFLLFHLFLMI